MAWQRLEPSLTARFSVLFREPLLPLHRSWRDWFRFIGRRMSQLICVSTNLRSSLLFQAGSQRLDIIINNGWLDENQQLVSFAVVRSELEQIPEPRYVHQVGDPVVIFSNLILDEPAQNYGCAARDR